ncbi:MAG: hypothetical protein AMXMBFR48_07460 [Ignavibacteriales bacterium]
MSKESNLSKGLLIGFLTGAVVGGAVALLYAPKSGKELRNDLAGKADDILDEAEKMFNEGKTRSEKLVTDAKVKADELLVEAKKVLDDARGKASEVYAQSKEKIASEGGRIKEAVKAGVDNYKEHRNS